MIQPLKKEILDEKQMNKDLRVQIESQQEVIL
jgi:hypothetical protein